MIDTRATVAEARASSRRLSELLRCEHGAMADFLLALAEFDRLRLWVQLGHAGLFSYLNRELGLSAGAAHYRKVAAHLVQRFPELAEPLGDGRLCLTSVVELARVITPENRSEILPRFFHRSRREARAVAVGIRPASVVPRRDLVTGAEGAVERAVEPAASEAARGGDSRGDSRNAPGPFHLVETELTHPIGVMASGQMLALRSAPQPPADASPVPSQDPPVLPGPVQAADPSIAPDSRAAQAGSQRTGPTAPRTAALGTPHTAPHKVEPLTTELRRLHVTVTVAFVEKLEYARAGESHAHPGASAGRILEAGLDLLLARQALRRGDSRQPQRKPRPSRDEHLTAAVRRAVWKRDEGRCQWPVDGGGVCGSTLRLEVDHVVPRARGGASSVENCRLVCRFHNDLAARQAFGNGWMDRFTGRAADGQNDTAAGSRQKPTAGSRQDATSGSRKDAASGSHGSPVTER